MPVAVADSGHVADRHDCVFSVSAHGFSTNVVVSAAAIHNTKVGRGGDLGQIGQVSVGVQ